MWIVRGKTVSGKDVEYKVPTGKDTDKAFVLALAFQEHGRTDSSDALTSEVDVTWTSDNVFTIENPIRLATRSNYAVEKRLGKGLYERFSTRAYRSSGAAVEAMESAASEFPNDIFRVVETYSATNVTHVSKNGLDVLNEKPEKVEEPKAETATAEGSKPKTPAKAAPKPKAA